MCIRDRYATSFSAAVAIAHGLLEEGAPAVERYKMCIRDRYNLIGNLNGKENIEVGAYLSDHALDIDELLHTLGLYEHRYKLPNQLSGGQQPVSYKHLDVYKRQGY